MASVTFEGQEEISLSTGKIQTIRKEQQVKVFALEIYFTLVGIRVTLKEGVVCFRRCENGIIFSSCVSK